MASDFEMLPAIDLRGGRVVRLEQGSFERETAFSADPAAVARRFVEAGARWLHVVDLDGARAGTPTQLDAIGAIVGAVGGRAAVEVSGGLRSEEAVASALAAGATRVALGTAAVERPQLVEALVARHGAARIAVAVDVRGGRAIGQAWRDGARGADPAALIVTLLRAGAETFEVTAIERDGLGRGPDLELLGRLVEKAGGRIIASGGIRSAADIRAVAAIGCSGAIVGRALYDGTLSLDDALAATAKTEDDAAAQ